MGQHSAKPSRPNPERQAPTKRRWVTVAAGAAVVAAASTTAWAAVANDDAPKTTTALDAAPSPAYTKSETPSTAAKTPKPNTPSTKSAAPKPSDPKTTALPKAAAAQPETKPVAKAKSVPVHKVHKVKTRVLSSGTCGASFYDEGQMTASGERFNPSAMTAAHKTLPLGSRVRVTNPANGDSVTVRINDRGPYVGGRCLDLSSAAFSAIGDTGSGVMRVKYEVLARS